MNTLVHRNSTNPKRSHVELPTTMTWWGSTTLASTPSRPQVAETR